jgi:hypothetical protein
MLWTLYAPKTDLIIFIFSLNNWEILSDWPLFSKTAWRILIKCVTVYLYVCIKYYPENFNLTFKDITTRNMYEIYISVMDRKYTKRFKWKPCNEYETEVCDNSIYSGWRY